MHAFISYDLSCMYEIEWVNIVYLNICTVCISICICLFSLYDIYICVCGCMYMCVWYLNIYIYIYTYIWYLYVCLYVCVYVCVCLDIHCDIWMILSHVRLVDPKSNCKNSIQQFAKRNIISPSLTTCHILSHPFEPLLWINERVQSSANPTVFASVLSSGSSCA